jgi:hypothetical protein
MDELVFQPDKVEIVATRVDGDLEDPGFYFKVTTPAKDVWPCLRRWSACVTLRDKLLADENPALKGVPFPQRKMFFGKFGQRLDAVPPTAAGDLQEGGDAAAAPHSATQQRKEQLQTWLNEVVTLCPGDADVLAFLCDDNSVSTEHARELGIDVISSNPVRKHSVETAPENAAALEQHAQRIRRQHKQLMASLDSKPERARVLVAPAPAADSSDEDEEPDFAARLSGAFASLRHNIRAAATDTETARETRWKAYYIQCFAPSAHSWYVRRSLSDVCELRNALLKTGNPAVRATSTRFPSKMQDAFRPRWSDDSPEDATERKAEIEAWLNEMFGSVVGDDTFDKFFAQSDAVSMSYECLSGPLQLLEEPNKAAAAQQPPRLVQEGEIVEAVSTYFVVCSCECAVMIVLVMMRLILKSQSESRAQSSNAVFLIAAADSFQEQGCWDKDGSEWVAVEGGWLPLTGADGSVCLVVVHVTEASDSSSEDSDHEDEDEDTGGGELGGGHVARNGSHHSNGEVTTQMLSISHSTGDEGGRGSRQLAQQSAAAQQTADEARVERAAQQAEASVSQEPESAQTTEEEPAGYEQQLEKNDDDDDDDDEGDIIE